MTTVSPVIEVAKEVGMDNTGIVILSNGAEARLVPVPVAVMTEATSKVKDPPVPMWADPNRDGRFVPNPNDPEYIAAVKEAETKRTNVMLDAAALFGIELLTPIPPQSTWMPKLKRIGINFSGYDMEDPVEIEFIYKRYILAVGDVVTKIMQMSAVSASDVDRADMSFRRKA